MLIDFTDYFQAAYPNQKPQCQKCGVSKELDACRVDTATLFICDDCYRSLEDEISEANLEQKYAPPNYLSGFTGSLLFSIPGILVTVLLFVFFNTLAAVSSVLYVILGIKGYKKFNGKNSRFGVIVIIASTLIMVALGIVVAYSVLILKEIGTIDMDSLLYILKIPEVQREIIQNIVMSYVVSGFFLFFQIIQMMKEWKAERVLQRSRDI